jgi:glycine cleavage system H lipoate-binding protein
LCQRCSFALIADEIGIVESVKAASDVYAPVSGEVTEVNKAVVDTPSIINKSAQSDGMRSGISKDHGRK